MSGEVINDSDLTEIERLLALSGNYHRRIQFTDWQTTTPGTLADHFAHALRESYTANPAARFWWVETGEEGAPLIVGYLGNGPSSELSAWLLGAGPSIIARLREVEAQLSTAQADAEGLREQVQALRFALEPIARHDVHEEGCHCLDCDCGVVAESARAALGAGGEEG